MREMLPYLVGGLVGLALLGVRFLLARLVKKALERRFS